MKEVTRQWKSTEKQRQQTKSRKLKVQLETPPPQGEDLLGKA
jgi:hypothetical protein